MRTRWRVAIVVAVIAAAWVVGGVLRAPTAAQDWFARQHGAGATVRDVDVQAVSPAIPPFWQVTISGDIMEPGRTTPSYRSNMIVWIEPFTGVALPQAAG